MATVRFVSAGMTLFNRALRCVLPAMGLAAFDVLAQVCGVPGVAGPASISGVVNSYYAPTTAGTYAGAASIALGTRVGAATDFSPGDLALVIQMQCANINAVNSSAYGGNGTTGSGYTDPASGCLAGRYEYARVATFTGGTITFVGGLANSYVQDATTATNRRTFQVIRVPQYSSATLTGTVTAPYWNGSTGAVVVLDVAGQLSWAGQTIDVAGRGFRGGGGVDQSGFNLASPTLPPYLSTSTTPEHAPKGEGIAGTPRQVWDPVTNATVDLGATWGGYSGGNYGRGAPGNAGGGGDNYNGGRDNGGGGGGGNAGAGGRAGLGWRTEGWNDAAASAAGYPNVAIDNTTVFNLAGRGGSAFAGSSSTRLVMGGGGGAGGENSNSTGTFANGGAGGGIVLVRAGSITGSGAVVANGLAGGSQTGNDAGGGGGAGGSVLVWSAAGGVGTLSINVAGGAGGDSFLGGTVAHAGGGGGSSGVAFVSSTTNVSANMTGGRERFD